MKTKLRTRKLPLAAALPLPLLLLLATPAGNRLQAAVAAATPQFKVLAFYTGPAEGDAAHVSFEQEARTWFAQLAGQYNFSFTATTDWDMLDSLTASQYQVVMFLDDAPHTAAQRAGFQNYMQNGGGFFGFHVSAFNTDPSSWDWYYNQLLGTGAFQTNTWGPAAAVLDNDSPAHPSMRRVPAKYTSNVSEWYSWQKDLRQNPDITILASVDAASFPLGTDPDQAWYGGYYPIMWTNKNYKMIYANFGHNDMNYSANIPSSATFADPVQDAFVIDGLLWLAGAPTSSQSTDPIAQNAWFNLVNAASGKCVDARGAATANGTAIQQYACNGSAAQQFQLQYVDGPYLKIANRNNPSASLDVTDMATADNAPIQLWTYGGGKNQQWQAIPEGNGVYHLTGRHAAQGQGHQECLAVPGTSSADSVQLVQQNCNGSAAQSFRLLPQS